MSQDFISAIKNGNIELVKKFIDDGCDINCEDGIALYRAIEAEQMEITNLLLDSGAEITGETSTMYVYAAARNAWLTIVKRLVEGGAGVIDKDNLPLKAAIHGKHDKIVEYLIEKGADPKDPVAMLYAVKSGRKILVEILLKNGADPNKPVNNIVPLALIRRDSPMAEVLIKYGAKKPVIVPAGG